MFTSTWLLLTPSAKSVLTFSGFNGKPASSPKKKHKLRSEDPTQSSPGVLEVRPDSGTGTTGTTGTARFRLWQLSLQARPALQPEDAQPHLLLSSHLAARDGKVNFQYSTELKRNPLSISNPNTEKY